MTHRDRLSPERAAGSCWEAWYQAAAPEQRQQSLVFARQFGVVPARLLPSFDVVGANLPLLPRLLAGQTEPPEFINSPDFSPRDPELDPCQRRAVARALASPDLSLLLGCAGTGKTRAVAELLVQSLARGQRVLFVSGAASGVFPALELLPEATRESSALLLGDIPPGPLSCLSLAARQKAAASRAQNIRRSLHEAQALLDALRTKAEAASATAAAHLQRLDAVRAAQDAAAIARNQADPEEPTGAAWATAVEESKARDAQLSSRLPALATQREAILAAQGQRRSRRERLAPLDVARRAGHWWTLGWWQSLFAGDVAGRLADLDREDASATQALASLEDQAAELIAAREAVAVALSSRRSALCDQERVERLGTLAAHEADLARQSLACLEDWKAFWGAPAPSPDAAGLASGLERLREQRDAETTSRDALRRWADALDQAQPRLETLLLTMAPLVAGCAEAVLGMKAGEFDLLVVEDAHLLKEEALMALACRAPRWTLCGEPSLATPVLPGRSPGRSAIPFHRLWEKLHADPRRLPCRWRVVTDRLVASLRPLAEARPGSACTESVYDRPEVELRIATSSEGAPCVFEVSFPASTPLHEARAFIYHELGELSIEANGGGAHWHDDDGTWCLRLSMIEGETSLVPIEEGVAERLVRCAGLEGCPGWTTADIVFDRARGWDRGRAEQWAASRLGLRDTGRTTCLDAPRRAEPSLARFLADLLHRRPSTPPALAVFVPVPGLTAPVAPRGRSACGAGLEIEWAESCCSSPPILAPDVAALLPASGIANPAEAQAILGILERDLADESFTAQALAWQEANDGPAIAVLSCFPAQVALLRARIEPLARNSRLRIQVRSPESLRGRGCWSAVVSLVRSKDTQAVPFSSHPDALALALTRAGGRLCLVGDPGSLLRRSQWFGGLAGQPEALASHEQALLQAIAAAWPDRMASAFVAESGKPQRSRESSSV